MEQQEKSGHQETSFENPMDDYGLIQKEERGEDTRNEYRDCIILQGEFSNTILNKGLIEGGISQNCGSEGGLKERAFDFGRAEEIHRFIRTFGGRKELLDFFCIAFLEIVPLFLLAKIREALKSALPSLQGQGWEDPFGMLETELQTLGLQRVKAVKKGRKGRETLECLMFCENVRAQEARRIIWEEYRELRQPILGWLIELKKEASIAALLFVQIREALTELSLRDFSYARTNLFPALEASGTYGDRGILVSILEEYIETEMYDPGLDKALLEKMSRGYGFWWQAAYRLYHEKKTYRFQEKTEEVLLKLMHKEMEFFPIQEEGRHENVRTSFDFYPAYENRQIERLFMKTLCQVYSECRREQEKKRFGYYFCWIIREDFRMEGAPRYQLMTVRCLEDPDLKKRIKGMYIEVWRRRRFRLRMGYILQQHFMELEKQRRPWKYMKDFFKTVAFAGEQEDFEHTVCFLERAFREKGCGLAEEIRRWLEELLRTREKEEQPDDTNDL